MRKNSYNYILVFIWSLFLCNLSVGSTLAYVGGGIRNRAFFIPNADDKPKLILISGCAGTGKSVFGMTVALDQGILRCISTETVRQVMRSFVAKNVSPALHRSSYAPAYDGDDPVRSWREACTVLSKQVEALIDDSITRGVSLVVEGPHVVPSNDYIKKWEENGGLAAGCLLHVEDSESHKAQLRLRGFLTGTVGAAEVKIKSFDRMRLIQDEMKRLAIESNWVQIEGHQSIEDQLLVLYQLDSFNVNIPKKLT